MSYFVSAAGRAYCGPRFQVAEGEVLVGAMTQTSADEWLITSTRAATGDVSKYSATVATTVDAAYLTCEAMICYGCNNYPSKPTTFSANVLKDASGSTLSPAWVSEVRHGECGQAVEVNGGAVTLIYPGNSSAASAR